MELLDSLIYTEDLISIDENIIREVLPFIPESLARERLLLPISYNPTDKTLRIITAKLENIAQKEVILSLLQKELSNSDVVDITLLHYADTETFRFISNKFYKGVSNYQTDYKNKTNTEDTEAQSEAQKIFSEILKTARVAGASDIHIIPLKFGSIVRFRIHGSLRRSDIEVKEEIKLSLIRVIKTWCDLNTTNTKVPQDGSKNEPGCDYRISTMPTINGDSIVIRLFDAKNALAELDNMNINISDLQEIKNILRTPSGMILMTGPTGSGKTSLQYACLNFKGTEKYIILSGEDPVEQRIDGIAQSQVEINKSDESLSNTQEKILMASLRHDPDIILIGEIRSKATGDTCIQASQTGHLVFSTLHTKSAIDAVERMVNLGVSRYAFLSQIVGIIGQRLVAINCPHCREKIVSDYNDILPEKYISQLPEGLSTISKGCLKCNHTGISHRIPILEIIKFNLELRDLFSREVGWVESKNILERNNFKPLWDKGFELVKSGDISLEELASEVVLEY